MTYVNHLRLKEKETLKRRERCLPKRTEISKSLTKQKCFHLFLAPVSENLYPYKVCFRVYLSFTQQNPMGLTSGIKIAINQ